MTTDSTFRNHLALAPLYLGLLITAAVYWPGLSGPFFFDDHANILLLEEIRLKALSFESIRQAMESGNAGPLGRPVSYLSFAFNYYFGEYAPFPYKLTNLVIHGLNGILSYLIALSALSATRMPDSGENTRLYAAFIAMAWLLHPIQLTSVLYVVQRMTSLSAFFLLAALYFHIKARQLPAGRPGTAFLVSAWLIFWPLSIFSKESGLLFIAFIFLYEAIIQRHIKRGFDKFSKILLAAVLCLGVGIMLYFLTQAGQKWLLGGYGSRPFTLSERLLTEPRVLWSYLGLIFVPRLSAFSLYHDDMVLSTGLFAPWTTLPALLGILGLFAAAWLTRLRNPLVSFAIAWFLTAHSLESTVFALELVHEHRNYVGLFGILLLPLALLRTLKQNKTLRIASTAAMLALLFFSVLITAMRSHQFGDGLRRALMEAEYHPRSSRSHYTAGAELVKNIPSQNWSTAWYHRVRKHYELSVNLDPNFKAGFLALIQLNCMTGLTIERQWIDELVRRIARTPFGPADRNVLHTVQDMSLQNRRCLEGRDVRQLFNASFSNATVSRNSRMFLYAWYSDYLLFHENNLLAAKRALSKARKIAPSEPHLQQKWEQMIRLDRSRNEAPSG
ncbi:MAG: tetratricopeptide repeat protein [Gammaproteobacteria bacterium]